jgi:hypothetical protein
MRPPRWLTLALGGWIVLVTVAAANLTSWPVHTGVPLAVLAALTFAHGWIHHGWRVAGPVAFALVGAGALTTWADPTYAEGPAGSLAPKAAWTAAVVVAALDIAYALYWHRRRPTRDEPADRLTATHAALDATVTSRLDELATGLTAIEGRLTTVD